MTYDEMVEAATEAIVTIQNEEILAGLRGEYPANQWRPERWAIAVLSAVGIDAEHPRTSPSLMPSPR